jgi:Tol biopolymer transport system component
MMQRTLVTSLLLGGLLTHVLIFSGLAYAATLGVMSKNGNIYLVDKITMHGGNSQPSISPDGTLIAYLHKINIKVQSKDAMSCNNEILVRSINGSIHAIIKSFTHRLKLAGIGAIRLSCFSAPQVGPNDKHLYFIAAAYATSGAVFSYTIKNKTLRFISSGNTLQVVTSGRYSGDLIINQHRYFASGGSFNAYYLYSPHGKLLMMVGKSKGEFNFEVQHR